jgi:hypothetical protein
MRGYTTREKLRISAGAVASLVIVGWAVVLALAFLASDVAKSSLLINSFEVL